MGNCPVFRAEIYSNGFIVYDGIRFVENVGLFSGKLSREKLERLHRAFAETNFFELEDEYVEPWTDLPTVFISYSREGIRKKIKDYYGAPDQLKDLEEEVIRTIHGVRFRKRKVSFLLTK
jgi:hypothetical protein